MKKMLISLLVMVCVVGAFAQTVSAPSPAERSIAQAKKMLEKNSKDFEAYNALALALSRRARETSDVRFYTEAQEALEK